MLEKHPELAEVMTRDYFVDRKDEIPEGEGPWYKLPVFNFHKVGFMICCDQLPEAAALLAQMLPLWCSAADFVQSWYGDWNLFSVGHLLLSCTLMLCCPQLLLLALIQRLYLLCRLFCLTTLRSITHWLLPLLTLPAFPACRDASLSTMRTVSSARQPAMQMCPR